MPPPHVLAVDDHEQVIRVIERMLARAGYAVSATRSPAEALDWLTDASRPVDLLVTDVRMPGLSGPELAEQARAARPALPLLFISAYADYEELTSPFGAHWLCKPFSMADLLQAVSGALDDARPRPSTPEA